MIVAYFSLRVDLGKFSVRDISISFLRLRLLLHSLVVLTEVLLKVNALLEPMIAAPSHGNLIEVFKK